MNKKEVRKLHLGLYEIFWKSGGSSLASVGQNADGEMWFAPTNWITVPWYDWEIVSRVEEIKAVEMCEAS